MKLFSSDNQMQRFCIQKTYVRSSTYESINILYTFYIVFTLFMQKKYIKIVSVSQPYRFCIVCTLFVCARNIQRSFQLTRCIGFVQFVHSLYVQKNTFQVSRCFQLELSTSFAQFVHFLYTCRSLMYIFCTFIIIQNFDFRHLCLQFLSTFCIVFVQIFW